MSVSRRDFLKAGVMLPLLGTALLADGEEVTLECVNKEESLSFKDCDYFEVYLDGRRLHSKFDYEIKDKHIVFKGEYLENPIRADEMLAIQGYSSKSKERYSVTFKSGSSLSNLRKVRIA